MVAVSNQGRAANLAPDMNAEYCDGLVAQESDHARRRQPAKVHNGTRVDKTVDRLVSRKQVRDW